MRVYCEEHEAGHREGECPACEVEGRLFQSRMELNRVELALVAAMTEAMQEADRLRVTQQTD